MKPTREELLHLLRLVQLTRAEEIDCEEFLARVGGYVERLAQTGALPETSDELAHHLQICPECLEEFVALCRAHLGDRE